MQKGFLDVDEKKMKSIFQVQTSGLKEFPFFFYFDLSDNLIFKAEDQEIYLGHKGYLKDLCRHQQYTFTE